MNYIRGAISRPVTVSMFVVAVILFGIVSLDRLALNLLPDISYPSLTIDTAYTDAAPEEVENLITQPVEEAVGVVSGLTRISSVSRPGQSEVVLEFNWDTDMDLAVLDVREKLDFVELPRDAEKSVILRFDPSRDPIMRVRLQGLSDLRVLRFFAEKELKKNLESMDGVAAIKVVGGLEEEIQINIDEKKLAELNIPITQVTDILQRENLNMASGSLYDQESSYMVRTLNEFKSLGEMRRIIIRDEGGRQVRLEDIAEVVRGAKDREVIARLDGRESVEVAIYKEGDANTVTVSRAVTRRLASLKEAKIIPADVSYAIVADQADFIEQAIGEVRSNAWMGGLLATIILFLFLKDVRSTLMIGLSIPISIMATFALMYQTDLTLNIMSLGGIALGIGMLVDNSIVVLEAIDRHKRSGLELAEAVYRGTKEVNMAVTASTLTTVAVFLPLVFVEGVAGQLFKDQALTITYSLLASLVVALAVLPMLMAVRFRRAEELYGADPAAATAAAAAERPLSRRRWLRPLQRLGRWIARGIRALFGFIFGSIIRVVMADVRRIIGWIGRLLGRAIRPVLVPFDRAFLSLQRAYPNWLRLALDHKVVVIGLALLVALAAAGLYTTLGTELIPPLTQGEFTFEIQLPEGTSIEHTDRLMQDVESRIKQFPDVATVFSSIGGSNENQFARQVRKENTAAVYIVMKDRLDKAAETRCIDRVRGELDTLPEVSYKFSRPAHFTFKRPIEVEVVTYDLEQLRALSQRTMGTLSGITGLGDIKTTAEMGNPEIHVIFDRERLARLGLDENQVARVIRNKIRGDVATRFKEQDKQIDIMVRADEADRTTVAQVKELVINSAAAAGAPAPAGLGVPVKLGAVAEVIMARGPNEIHHIKSSRAAVVSANLSGRDLGSVSAEINRELRRLAPELPANATVALSGQNEELQTAYRSLLFALGLAAFLVYLVMAAQFESLVHPFIIMFTVPLGAVGAILGLAFTATPVSVMVFIGIIILVGIVVNNAIVLVDYANQLRAEGLSKREALLTAGQVRLRPILMTTLTTVLGLLPMSLGFGEGAEIRAPMAITVMSGLMFSTLLTLIVIPVVYEAVDRRVTVADQTAAAAKPEPLAGLQPSACE
ncbi:MAG TPA: efflux RND transporter permease subunit [Acidobacteriota bacterium]|nr:efflux RND transporter permease subunit [Acidobacteriota bacterium]HNR37697.1 efflux RND transporter permease subunit [Acidobacteriota bacterium]HNT99305.1 efflux RND transporter permease subunit [Acidobacteriota bacterium]HPB29084.1 efflux RND transporter permease subunit [Acidobacteriota bacterium]HQP72871.1 efflux RND transporter permease subunit [Acidobacteriota bacterium]